jgi:hypothetical protein
MNGRSKVEEGDEEDSPVSPPKCIPTEPKTAKIEKDDADEEEEEETEEDTDRPKNTSSPIPPAGERNIPSPQSSTGSANAAAENARAAAASARAAAMDLTPRGSLLFPGFPGLLPSSGGFPNHILAAAAAASGGGGSPSPALSQLSAFANSPFNPLGLSLPMRRKSNLKINSF